MKSINILYDREEDLFPAREEASSYEPENILIQVFYGLPGNREGIIRLQETLRDFFPGSPVIGATTDGEMINAKVKTSSIVINISFFKSTTVASYLISQNENQENAAGEMAAFFTPRKPKVIIVFGSGLKNIKLRNDVVFLEKLKDMMGDVIIAGGQAGTDNPDGEFCQFNESTIINNGYVAAALSGEQLRVKNAFSLGWEPLGKNMTITKAEGNRVESIDGISLGEIYGHYLGIDPEKYSPYLHSFPLMVNRNGIFTTVSPVSANDDGSYDFAQPLHPGEQVRLSYSDEITLMESMHDLKNEMDRYKLESLFIYSCSVRRRILGEYIHFDEEALASCHSSSGFFTFGEYYTDPKGQPHSFQQTMTVLMLSESPSFTRITPVQKARLSFEELKSRKLIVQKVLKNLLTSTTKELESKLEELASLAHFDPMTELANRRLFDEAMEKEIKRHERNGSPLSLIMLDVDHFKLFNDSYGHVAGDDCLRAIAFSLKITAKRPSDLPFRYGGEEFGCILPLTDGEGAVKIAEKIKKEIMRLKIPNKGSSAGDTVTASIGVITVRCRRGMTPTQLIEECDALLYQAKEQGRNRVVSKDLYKEE